MTRVPSCIMYARVVFCRPAHSRSVLFIFFVLLLSDLLRNGVRLEWMAWCFQYLFNK